MRENVKGEKKKGVDFDFDFRQEKEKKGKEWLGFIFCFVLLL